MSIDRPSPARRLVRQLDPWCLFFWNVARPGKIIPEWLTTSSPKLRLGLSGISTSTGAIIALHELRVKLFIVKPLAMIERDVLP